jgi:hypothetical protein
MTDATKTDVTQAHAPKTDAAKAPALIEGGLYVVRDGRLRRIVHADGLPRVEVSHDAKDVLHALQRRCRRLLRGFRPDIAILASAIIEYAGELPESQRLGIVEAYVREIGIGFLETPRGIKDESL